MDKLIIRGGKPARRRNPHLRRQECGAAHSGRHAAGRQPVTVGNVPHLHDITTTMELLGRMGVD